MVLGIDGKEIDIPGFGGGGAAPQPPQAPPSGGGFWAGAKEQLGLNQPAYQGSPQAPPLSAGEKQFANEQAVFAQNKSIDARRKAHNDQLDATWAAGAPARDQNAWDASAATAAQSGPMAHLNPAQQGTITDIADKYKYAAGQLPGMGGRSSDDPLNDNDWDFIDTLPGGVDSVASYKKDPASFQAPPPDPQGSLLANMTSSRRANMEKRPYR